MDAALAFGTRLATHRRANAALPRLVAGARRDKAAHQGALKREVERTLLLVFPFEVGTIRPALPGHVLSTISEMTLLPRIGPVATGLASSPVQEHAMTIELYVFPPSPRAFKVMAVANHLGLDWTLRFLDMRKGEHKAPDYAALNPNMRMPTLKDGDFVLWESSAIIQYLALKKPESGLLPTDERRRLDVTRWQFWEQAHWDPPCATFIFERVVKPFFAGIKDQDAAAIAKAEEQFHRAAAVLDQHLKGHEFIAGSAPTIADFGVGSPMILAAPAQLPLDRYAEIKRWYATLSALPGWRKTLEQCAMPAANAA